MRLRDHDKADLALAAVTLTVAAAGAVVEVSRRLRGARATGPTTRHPVRSPRPTDV